MLKKSLYILFISSSLFGIDIVIDSTHKLKSMKEMDIVYSKNSTNKMVENIVNGLLRDNKKEVLTDPETKRMWQDNKDTVKERVSWNKARSYCKSLVHGGYSNWYLPSMSELETIVEYTKDTPAIKEGFVNTATDRYWSSSVSVMKPNSAWNINFNKGSSDYKSKNRSCYVRCVRRDTKK